MFAMAGNPVSAGFMHEEQTVPSLVDLVSSPFFDSYDSHKVSRRLHHDSHSRKQRLRAFYAPFIVTSLLVATLVLLKCPFVSVKQMEARPPVRRLAAGEEDEGGKDLLQSIMEMCGIIPKAEAQVEGEGAAPPALPPEPPAGPSEAAAETEEPRKKKRKTKWLEMEEKEPSPEPPKKARVLPSPLPEEPSVTLPVEESVAGPSHAFLQGMPILSVPESPALVLQAPALPLPALPAGEGGPVTGVLVGEEGAAILALLQQPMLPAPPTQGHVPAEQKGREGAEAEALEERMIHLPATATAGRSTPPRPPALELHPFYRLPLGHRGGVLPVFDSAAALAASRETELAFLMKLVRPLFAKDILNEEELEVLHKCAYLLIAYSSNLKVSDFYALTPWNRLGPLACRLLVADTLWSICCILGPTVMETDKWWNTFMARLAVPASVLEYEVREPVPHIRDFIPKFVIALDMFRRGERPGAELLVELKRRIFRQPFIHNRFKRRTWDPWRADDAEFH